MRTPLAILFLAALGCGYHVTGTGRAVPKQAHSITIALFDNATREDGLEVHLRRAVEDEFRRHGVLSVVASGGDLVLDGTIKKFTSAPVTRIGRDQAVQYQGTITLGVTLKDKGSGKVLYTSSLQESQDFGVVSGVVVATSPRFLQGLINARDLPNLTSVQLTESRRGAALDELLELLAHDVYLQTMEGF